MIRKFTLFPAVLGLILLNACNIHNVYSPTQTSNPDSDLDLIRFTMAGFRWEEDSETKTQAQILEKGIFFTWSENDTVGIFPESGAQAYFPVAVGAGSEEAKFNGGGWALKKSCKYSAYYPYSRYNFDNSNIPLVYGIRHQDGNDNLDKLTQYDYMVSQMAVPEKGEVSFEFHHLSALLRFNLAVPEAADLTELSVISSQSVFPVKQNLDLSGSEPLVTTSETADTLKIKLSNLNLSEAGSIVLYALVPAVDLSGRKLTLLLKTSSAEKIFYARVTGNDFQSGKAYNFNASLTKLCHEYVDLGVGVKWATCNLGALFPEDYGSLFCWGETEPRTAGFDWLTYKYCMGIEKSLTKYCYSKEYGYRSFTDNLTVLEAQDDAATANWGGSWRMPTLDEMKSLLDETKFSWEFVFEDDVLIGCKVTSKIDGHVGNSIFLPAAGDGYMDAISGRGLWGQYWSSTLETEATKTFGPYSTPGTACGLLFGFQLTAEGMEFCQNNALRTKGRSIRPVYQESL